jgi:hypothetical protein
VYRRIGLVYSDLVQSERWLNGAKPCREAVLLTTIERGTPHLAPMLPTLTVHAARMLEEIGVQFDIASVEEPLPEARLVIWPGQSAGTPELRDALRCHLRNGGSLLAMDAALEGLEDVFGARDVAEKSADRPDETTAVSGCGHVQQTHTGFFRMTAGSGVCREWHGFEHVLTQPTRRILAETGQPVLAERLSLASEVPPCAGREVVGPIMVRNGRVIYSAVSLFAEAMKTGTPFPSAIIHQLCLTLLDQPLVRHSAGPTVAAHLHRSAPGYTLHLVHWALDRWGTQVNTAAAFPRLGPIDVELAIPEPVQAVTLEPSGTPIPYECRNGLCRFTVPGMTIWQIVGIRGTRS